jgi:hypothetical protein
MKRHLTLLAIAALFLVAACSSHEPPSREEMGPPPVPTAKERLAVLEKRLNLTPEQSKAIEPILAEECDRKSALMGKPGEGRKSPEETRKEREDLEWDICLKLSAHLTEDQMFQYSKLLEEEAKAMEKQNQDRPDGPPSGGGKGGPPPRR